MSDEARSAERVRLFLARHGLADAIVVHESSTKTAALAAEAMGCELGQIAKSLVFHVDGESVLCLVAGDRRGDPEAIAREMGAVEAVFAGPEVVREATGYDVGAVSPFDLPASVTVLVDETLGRFEVVYPAAGTASSMVPVKFQQLVAIASGRVCAISR